MPLTVVDGGMLSATNAQYTMFKNRIINGAMVIDQRNAGAAQNSLSGAGSGNYTVDRWRYQATQTGKFNGQQNAASVTLPSVYTNYYGLTSTSAYSVLTSDYFLYAQDIEGLNSADLAWGTSNASTVTLSFWVRSSLTGTFGGSIYNIVANRCYPFSYTISAANTWEQKSITIPGDTSGTWNKNNTIGITVAFSLGTGATLSGTGGVWTGSTILSVTGATSVVGTSGATFYVTGVQIEKGSTATAFDYRPYTTELQLCQRYFQIYSVTAANSQPICAAQCYTTTAAFGAFNAPVVFRTVPTLALTGTTGCYNAAAGNAGGTVALDIASTASTIRLNCTGATGLVAGNATGIYVSGAGSSMAFSAEL